jgi:hypothetical protein
MENFTELLIYTDDVNCKIYCDILKQENIKFEVKQSDIKAVEFGVSFFGSYIYVLSSDLEKAKVAIGLDKK